MLGKVVMDSPNNMLIVFFLLQTKKIETTEEELAEANNSKLPPLMNPTMLEASDDLTNLSQLNEPAGTFLQRISSWMVLMSS